MMPSNANIAYDVTPPPVAGNVRSSATVTVATANAVRPAVSVASNRILALPTKPSAGVNLRLPLSRSHRPAGLRAYVNGELPFNM